MQYGLLLALISYSITLSIKFSNDLKPAEHLTQNLQQEVVAQILELKQAKEQIEQQSEQRTAFFINVAHEAKTPLTLIQTNFDDYLESLKNKIPPELRNLKFYIAKMCRDTWKNYKSFKNRVLLFPIS